MCTLNCKYFEKYQENSELTIVISSRKTLEENTSLIENLNSKIGVPYDLFLYHNTEGESLTKIYNNALGISKHDIILFIHDDIEFINGNIGSIVKNIFKNNKEYGIFGVAGSATFDEGGSWWNYNEKYGQVLHRNGSNSWLTCFSDAFNEDLKEVVVIDGLFMAVYRKRIKQKFNEDFVGFDFYDITFCIDNYLTKEVKIGVTTKIKLAHMSIGERKPQWFVNHNKVNEIYKEVFPLRINKHGIKRKISK